MLIKVKGLPQGNLHKYLCTAMNASKNKITLLLIISSILLLVVLQGVWLKSSYEKTYFDLSKNTSNILRNSVLTLRELYMNRFIKSSSKIGTHDSTHLEKTDSLKIIISKVTHGNLPGKIFILGWNSDSLSIDSVRFYFKKDLEKESIELPFEIKDEVSMPPNHMQFFFQPNFFVERELFEPKENIYSNTLNIEWTRFDPIHRYYVEITGIRNYILNEITPQIAFSLFLTLLTSAAFVIMYRSIRAQQRLMELKNEFISNITHELKTPITTVGVAIEALRNFKGIDNPEITDEYLGIAQNELNRLSILAEKVLRTAIYEDKGIEFKPEPVELDKVIDQVLNSMKLVFEKQNAKVSFEKTGSDFSIMGSGIHLTNVLFNLLDNALKYNPLNPEINISLKEEGGNIILSVKDNGMGIPAEYQKKVFEKFFRVPTGDVHNIKGYGLGLSYVESVVKSHNGTIKLESEPGKGSKFTITLSK
jgi:two-component system, OmpR family, phosphate regulon sensor histidine kinase PhoR